MNFENHLVAEDIHTMKYLFGHLCFTLYLLFTWRITFRERLQCHHIVELELLNKTDVYYIASSCYWQGSKTDLRQFKI